MAIPTTQSRFLNDIVKAITDSGYIATVDYNFSNTGKLSIQDPAVIGELGSVGFNFQSDYVTFDITILGDRLLSQPPRKGYFDFYIKHTDIAGYKNFRSRLVSALETMLVA